jgi:hypothetical protein
MILSTLFIVVERTEEYFIDYASQKCECGSKQKQADKPKAYCKEEYTCHQQQNADCDHADDCHELSPDAVIIRGLVQPVND